MLKTSRQTYSTLNLSLFIDVVLPKQILVVFFSHSHMHQGRIFFKEFDSIPPPLFSALIIFPIKLFPIGKFPIVYSHANMIALILNMN